MARTDTLASFNGNVLATGVVWMDASLSIEDCNESAAALFGHSVVSLLGTNAGLYVPLLFDWQSRFTDENISFRSLTGLNTEVGTVAGRVLATVNRVAENRYQLELIHAEELLRLETQEQQAGLSEASRVLLRNLAHEIKNPLGGIRGAAQLLAMEIDRPEVHEYTDVIVSEVDRLRHLVDRLLLPYRNATQKVCVNIHEILERVIGLVQVQYPKGLVFERDYDVSAPDLFLDEEKTVQVFVNLLQNSAQALTEKMKTAEAKIRVVTRVERGVVIRQKKFRLSLRVDVIDNGVGVPEMLREKIFFPLVTTKPKGTGLGLSLVKTYVEQNGGDIELQCKPGMTDFIVRLPIGERMP